jgi:NhaP-type Na+/H+ or K+/H+ antiporter
MALAMGFLLFAFLLSAMGPTLTPIIVSVVLPVLWLISGGLGLILVVLSLREIIRKGVTRRMVYLRLALGIGLLWAFIYGAYYFYTYSF